MKHYEIRFAKNENVLDWYEMSFVENKIEVKGLERRNKTKLFVRAILHAEEIQIWDVCSGCELVIELSTSY